MTPAGYAVRADLMDIVDIFEVNRKECARLLMEYPKWTIAGTFKPKPTHDNPERVPVPGKDWQLESSIIEVRVFSDLVEHTVRGLMTILSEYSWNAVRLARSVP